MRSMRLTLAWVVLTGLAGCIELDQLETELAGAVGGEAEEISGSGPRSDKDDGLRASGSGSYLLVGDYDSNKVLRYDAVTGDFVDEFVPRNSGGLNQSQSLLFGPHDQNLFVGSGHFRGPGQLRAVLRYDGTTGAFIDAFVDIGPPPENCASDAHAPERCGLLTSVHSIIFGPDGNLYVGDWSGPFNIVIGGNVSRILRFDGTTGAFLDEFVPFDSGGLNHPFGVVFAPAVQNPNELDLYVSNAEDANILRYDGTTGDFLGAFVSSGSGGLTFPIGLTFGPDGNLYVASAEFITGTDSVMRYQGPSGPSPGAFIDVFIPPGSGGLLSPSGLLFGPDGNGDGHQDLYVTNSNFTGIGNDQARHGNVKRYDGVTGAFIDAFVPIGSGGMHNAWGLTFTETDPVTLAYTGGN